MSYLVYSLLTAEILRLMIKGGKGAEGCTRAEKGRCSLYLSLCWPWLQTSMVLPPVGYGCRLEAAQESVEPIPGAGRSNC